MKQKLLSILVLGFLFISGEILAQNRTITGKVTSEEDGSALAGVSVVVEGTSVGKITDVNGNYSIEVERGAKLVFSFVGMISQTREVYNSNVINVSLESDAQLLSEVVVMGYQNLNRNQLTGSAAQVGAEEISNRPAVSVDQVLQGKVAGVQINNTSGTPGSTTDIRIRGVSSISAGNTPLYVIDGVPMTDRNFGDSETSGSSSSFNGLSALNINDIESVTVLKDASAIAAYGARGTNGVIVITTKKGTSGKATFNLSATYGFSNDATDGPSVLTAAQREELFYEAVYNDYGATYGFTKEEAKAFATENELNGAYLDWEANGKPEGNWADEITNKNASQYDINLSASGGTNTSSYYISGGYRKQEATVIGSEYERYNGSLRYSNNLTKNLTFTTSNTGSYGYQDGLLEQSAYFSSPRAAKYFMTPLQTPYNADGTLNNEELSYWTSIPNPLTVARENLNDNRLTRIITNNALKWNTPLENLVFETRLNFDFQFYDAKVFQNRHWGDGASTNGYASRRKNNFFDKVFQNSLSYFFDLNSKHNFDIKVIQEYQDSRLNYMFADGEDFAADGLSNLNQAGKPTTANSSFTDWKVASYTGLLNYNFDSRYILNASFRREGNSRFSSENRWGNFWSIGAAWNLHEEQFLKSKGYIDIIKLRASFGKTGNAFIDLNEYQALLAYDANYAGGAAVYPSNLGNQNLGWENANNYEFGVDFGLFKRLTGQFSYFSRETTDMLLDVPLSRTTGFNDQTQNIGSMKNSGVEFELSGTILQTKDVLLRLGGNIATVKNEVTKLAVDPEGNERNITNTSRRVEVGHPVYAWYLPTWAGIDPETGVDTWYVNGEGSEVTANFSEANRVFQGGSALPKLTAGLFVNLEFKGVYLDANAYYAGGHKVYESWHRYTHENNGYSIDAFQGISNDIENRWQNVGDITTISKATLSYLPWRYSSKFLYDGDYIRLRNLTVGYKFPKSMFENTAISGLNVFARGVNLFTWVKDDRLLYDPEISTSGMTSLTTPPTKSIIFGFNLNF